MIPLAIRFAEKAAHNAATRQKPFIQPPRDSYVLLFPQSSVRSWYRFSVGQKHSRKQQNFVLHDRTCRMFARPEKLPYVIENRIVVSKRWNWILVKAMVLFRTNVVQKRMVSIQYLLLHAFLPLVRRLKVLPGFFLRSLGVVFGPNCQIVFVDRAFS